MSEKVIIAYLQKTGRCLKQLAFLVLSWLSQRGIKVVKKCNRDSVKTLESMFKRLQTIDGIKLHYKVSL